MAYVIEPDRAAFQRNQKSRVVLTDGGNFRGTDYPEEWDYEPEPEESFDADRIFSVQSGLINISPSKFTELAIQMPDKENQRFVPFSFDGRRYLRQIYDSPAKKILLKTGRQCEKSTLLGNKTLAYSCINVACNTLYVSPTNLQTKVFSNDRLKEPIETSDFLKSWTTTKLSDNVFLKKFINRSQITMRYAYLNADRCRGVAGIDLLLIDELQDILVDNIPVIEQTTAHGHLKLFSYSGTPKSLDNTIEKWWTELSTQNEWVVPCHRHSIITGTGQISKVYWNVLTQDNIGTHGIVCDWCGKPIDAQDPMCQWASMNPSVVDRLSQPFEGYHITQLMVPWVKHSEILDYQRTYPQGRFFNEVLGMSYDTGTRPLTQQDLIDNCNPNFHLTESFIQQLRTTIGDVPVYAGIDWGTGENTYTVLALGAYLGGRFSIFYLHRYEGPETDPDFQFEHICRIMTGWRVRLAGCDYGGGFHMNDKMIKKFGWQRIAKYQYSTPSAKVRFDDGLKRHLVNRTEVMSDVFNAIKRKNTFWFPNWDHFKNPYGLDCLNIFSEYSETRRMNEYKKAPKSTDDAFHAILYCFLASMIFTPRPDVISPMASAVSDPVSP